jgi:hypothetical protein
LPEVKNSHPQDITERKIPFHEDTSAGGLQFECTIEGQYVTGELTVEI